MKMSKNIVSALAGWMGKWAGGSGGGVQGWVFAVEAMDVHGGGMGVFHQGETTATTAETYQNSSYILAQSLGLPED